MLHVGLTGGLASGKSSVGRSLADMGCLLIKADELGHQALNPDGEAYDAVVREFGRDILNTDASINRRALATRAFSDPAQLDRLNALVHPASGRWRRSSRKAIPVASPSLKLRYW
jgi:dephospho-CoA kinase